jgi:hypothetical protein
MKKIILATILSTLFSCFSKSADNTNREKHSDMLVGSTLDNINNSVHSVVQFQVDNKVCFATINQYFKYFNNKKAFPYSLWITVETLNKNSEGHPVDTEANLFNSIEDSLIDHFVSKTPFCFIGRTTRDGYREIMYYVSDKVKATELINTFIKENKFNRKIEFTISPDSTWENVGGFY